MANLAEHQRKTKKAMRAKTREENRAIHQFNHFAPMAIKEAFVQGNYEAALDGLASAIRDKAPWALTAWLQAAGVVGSMQQVVVQINQMLGVADETEAKRLVESGRRLEQMKADGVALEDLRDDAVEALRMVFQEHPEWRHAVLGRLGSEAVEVNGGRNGHG